MAGEPESKTWEPGQSHLEVFRDMCASVEGREGAGILVPELWFVGDRGKRLKYRYHLRVRTLQPLGTDETGPYVMVPPPSVVKTVFWGSQGLGVVGIWLAEEKLPMPDKMNSENPLLITLSDDSTGSCF